MVIGGRDEGRVLEAGRGLGGVRGEWEKAQGGRNSPRMKMAPDVQQVGGTDFFSLFSHFSPFSLKYMSRGRSYLCMNTLSVFLVQY